MARQLSTAAVAIANEFGDSDEQRRLKECLEAARLAFIAKTQEVGFGDLPDKLILLQPCLIPDLGQIPEDRVIHA